MNSVHSGKHLSSFGAETAVNAVPGACGRAPVPYCRYAVTSRRTELAVEGEEGGLAPLPYI